MTWKYRVFESVGPGEVKELASVGGFATEDDALAAAETEANRIASCKIDPSDLSTLSTDAFLES